MTQRRLVAVPAVAMACVAALIAGCGADDGSAPAGTRQPSSSSSGTPQPGSTEGATDADIAAAKLKPCPPSERSVPALPDGLPDVTLPCLGEGPDVRLAGLRGTPMVVALWASWCGPCVQELPIMGRVSKDAGESVRFFGIDYQDDRVEALEMAAATEMGFPSVQDPDIQVRSGLRVAGLPATFFVRADGTIAGRTAQISSEAELRELISRYLDVNVPG